MNFSILFHLKNDLHLNKMDFHSQIEKIVALDINQ
jgi:hypothetical protein